MGGHRSVDLCGSQERKKKKQGRNLASCPTTPAPEHAPAQVPGGGPQIRPFFHSFTSHSARLSTGRRVMRRPDKTGVRRGALWAADLWARAGRARLAVSDVFAGGAHLK
jgi:hypothetical protein